jgi:hypothetical protein
LYNKISDAVLKLISPNSETKGGNELKFKSSIIKVLKLGFNIG